MRSYGDRANTAFSWLIRTVYTQQKTCQHCYCTQAATNAVWFSQGGWFPDRWHLKRHDVHKKKQDRPLTAHDTSSPMPAAGFRLRFPTAPACRRHAEQASHSPLMKVPLHHDKTSPGIVYTTIIHSHWDHPSL